MHSGQQEAARSGKNHFQAWSTDTAPVILHSLSLSTSGMLVPRVMLEVHMLNVE